MLTPLIVFDDILVNLEHMESAQPESAPIIGESTRVTMLSGKTVVLPMPYNEFLKVLRAHGKELERTHNEQSKEQAISLEEAYHDFVRWLKENAPD